MTKIRWVFYVVHGLTRREFQRKIAKNVFKRDSSFGRQLYKGADLLDGQVAHYSDPSSPHMQSGDNRGTYLIGLLWGITERNASCTRFESKGREGVWEKTQKEGK